MCSITPVKPQNLSDSTPKNLAEILDKYNVQIMITVAVINLFALCLLLCHCFLSRNEDICTTVGRVTPEIYSQFAAAAKESYALEHYAPLLLSLQICNFVSDAFTGITSSYCPPLKHYLKIINPRPMGNKFSDQRVYHRKIAAENCLHLSVASSALSSRKVSIYFPNSKIDPLTRRLQLVDATGGIDVLIPDLPLNWNSNDIFEVTFLFVSALPSLLGSLIGV
ncbi:envelope glycoprotein B [Trifolium repens]|nr:envelope glycoprotein B [Trifolium repens]